MRWLVNSRGYLQVSAFDIGKLCNGARLDSVVGLESFSGVYSCLSLPAAIVEGQKDGL